MTDATRPHASPPLPDAAVESLPGAGTSTDHIVPRPGCGRPRARPGGSAGFVWGASGQVPKVVAPPAPGSSGPR